MNKLNIIKILTFINVILSLIIATINYNTNDLNMDIFENLISITNEQNNISHIFASTTQQSIELLIFYNSFNSQRNTLDKFSLSEKENELFKKVYNYNNNSEELNNYLNQASNKIENRIGAINEDKNERSKERNLIILLSAFLIICSMVILYVEASSQNDLLILSNKLDEIKNTLSDNDGRDSIELQIKADIKIPFFGK